MSLYTKQINKSAISHSFSQAVHSYDRTAILQREVGSRLLERLKFIKIKPKRILDLGSGTGYFAKQLAVLYPNATVVGLDITEDMVKFAHKNSLPYPKISFCCGDAEFAPFPNNSFDLIFSNCMLQWINDLHIIYRNLHNLLSPKGLLLFTSFGPDTLKELRYSFAINDSYTHVNHFHDMHNIGDALLHANFLDPVVDKEQIIMTYDSPRTLMSDLKKTGARNLSSNRPKHFMTPRQLESVLTEYQCFRTAENRYPATFEIIYGHAWQNSDTPKQQKNEHGHSLIPVEHIKKI